MISVRSLSRGIGHVLAFGLAMTATATLAESTLRHGALDPRIKEVTYNASDVVRVVGHFGYSTDIEFAAGEEVQNIALGDTLAWEVAPASNHLFVKPREDNAATNMTVMTNRRVYQLVLDARPHRTGTRPTKDMYLLLRYRYPEDDAARERNAEQERIDGARKRQMESSLGKLADVRNWNYYACGERNLWPAEIFDDGRFTYMRFPAAQQIPAVFEIAVDKAESIVDGAMEGDYYVVRHVAPGFVLRQGERVACVQNRSYNRYGVPTPTGTRSMDVYRDIAVPIIDGGVTTAPLSPAPAAIPVPAEPVAAPPPASIQSRLERTRPAQPSVSRP